MFWFTYRAIFRLVPRVVCTYNCSYWPLSCPGIPETLSTSHKYTMQYRRTCTCNDHSTSIMTSLLFQTQTVTSSRNLECLHRPVQKFCPHVTCLYCNFHPSKHRSCLAKNYRIHHTHCHWRHPLACNCLGVSEVRHFIEARWFTRHTLSFNLIFVIPCIMLL